MKQPASSVIVIERRRLGATFANETQSGAAAIRCRLRVFARILKSQNILHFHVLSPPFRKIFTELLLLSSGTNVYWLSGQPHTFKWMGYCQPVLWACTFGSALKVEMKDLPLQEQVQCLQTCPSVQLNEKVTPR